MLGDVRFDVARDLHLDFLHFGVDAKEQEDLVLSKYNFKKPLRGCWESRAPVAWRAADSRQRELYGSPSESTLARRLKRVGRECVADHMRIVTDTAFAASAARHSTNTEVPS